MKKIVSIILAILLVIILIVWFIYDAGRVKKDELAVRMNVKQVQTYGNQTNQQMQTNYLFKDGDWIYAVKDDRIVRFLLDDPKTERLIHDFESKLCYPSDISKLGDWVYFMLEEVAEDESSLVNLYRMKTDGSGMTKLANDVMNYILTENEVYYESYKDWKPDKDSKPDEVDELPESGIYVMSLNGRQERRLPGVQSLMGIDDGWIYYYPLNHEDLYRIRPDGDGAENISDLFGIDGEEITNYIFEKDQMIFTHYDIEDEQKTYLVLKAIHGKETLLDTGVSFDCMNRDGEWLYYSEQNKVYKINLGGERKKQLVYQFSEKEPDGFYPSISSILLYNDGILLNTSYEAVYIKKDGSVIDLGQILEY